MNSMVTVFSWFTVNFQFESHRKVASTDSCSCCSQAADVSLTVVKAVSSANWSHWDGSETHIGKSTV